MIYLYGQNKHLCFIRTHAFNDTEKKFPIMREEAEKILKKKYRHHCGHIGAKNERAKVYLRR
jgi:hypothetical protein